MECLRSASLSSSLLLVDGDENGGIMKKAQTAPFPCCFFDPHMTYRPHFIQEKGEVALFEWDSPGNPPNRLNLNSNPDLYQQGKGAV